MPLCHVNVITDEQCIAFNCYAKRISSSYKSNDKTRRQCINGPSKHAFTHSDLLNLTLTVCL